MSHPNIRFWYSPSACSLSVHRPPRNRPPFHPIRQKINNTDPTRPAQSESFRTINPRKLVPVVAIDNEIVTEVPAIMTAISAFVPEKHLIGRTTMEAVRCYEWLNFLSGMLHVCGYWALWRPKRFVDADEGETVFEALHKGALRTILRSYGEIEERLESGVDCRRHQPLIMLQVLIGTNFPESEKLCWGLRYVAQSILITFATQNDPVEGGLLICCTLRARQAFIPQRL